MTKKMALDLKLRKDEKGKFKGYEIQLLDKLDPKLEKIGRRKM